MLSEGRQYRITTKDITSPTQEERDYEIILDKIWKLSLKEDFTTDHPIIENQTTYYLLGDTIVTINRPVICS